MHAGKRSIRNTRPSASFRRLPLAAAVAMAFAAPAWAQSADEQAEKGKEARTLDTITVTAQKREENLQKVPISLQVLGNTQLEQQNVAAFNDYAKLIPSLSFGTSGGGVFSGPGFVQLYMRGVASGTDVNHSSSQPSAGMYLDEQPITTITGSLDIHMYDMARVEALAGPQGTLYGASAQAGTVRLITNKPDPSGYAAGYSVEVNAIDGGGIGHVLEGFVNLPINKDAAVRLVGWEKHDAGYIDNMPGTRQFPVRDPNDPDQLPSWGGVLDNTANCTASATRYCSHSAKDDFNTADTYGVRAALRFDINEDWTITPALIAQKQRAHGSAGADPSVGRAAAGFDSSSRELAVKHFYPESSDDRWNQAALTVQGRIGNFDVVYAFSRLTRDVDSEADYTDYSFWYDSIASYGAYICGDFDLNAFACTGGASPINSSQYIRAKDAYRKTSHELRFSSPQDRRLRLVAGLFWQQQSHDIEQDYQVAGLSPQQEVTGWNDTIWLTQQDRRDRDEAVFGELSYDLTDHLTATGGVRFFRARNSLQGFFGMADWGWITSSGEARCQQPVTPYEGAPCSVFDKSTRESDSLGRFNLTWNIDDKKLVYATWSQGYRPGGINRRGTLPPYQSDFLTNYELGWKTSWAGDRLTFNGALFREDWKDFQFSYLGANGLTEIRNANQARINGLEMDLAWAATYNLQITGGVAFYDAKLTKNYCGWSTEAGDPVTVCPAGTINPNGTYDDPDDDFAVDGPQAAAGTRLPVSARFKGNANARYTFDWRGGEAFWQVGLSHQGDRSNDLRNAESALLGELDAYTLVDLSVGFRRNNWSVDVFLKNAFDERAEMARFAQCATLTCGNQPYTVYAQPRTLGIRFSQEF